MGFVTGNQTSSTVSPSGRDHESQNAVECRRNDEEKNLSKSAHDPSQSGEYPAYLARATNDAVRDWNVTAGGLTWPQGLTHLFGYDPAAVDSVLGFWDGKVHPSDRNRVIESIREALSGNAEGWQGEYRFQHANGKYLQILERAAIVREQSGRAARFIGSMMDITAHKQLQDQLYRSQKMDAFGQLAGSVAHDFNNFLTTIIGYSDLVLSEPGVKGAATSHIDEIRKAAGRASTLVGQLLAFSRRQALEPHIIEVNSIISNMERSLLRLLGDNISVVCHLHQEKSGAHLKVDAGQLTQIILNLAVNARDAMKSGGQLILETGKVVIENKAPAGPGELVPGNYVVIRLTDNGVGMPEEVKAHLFEPFFTTKEAAGNSGLGLATSYGIVRQSGGQIRIESELGKGTTVQIYFPEVAAPAAPSYKKPSLRLLPTGTETILVLEDDVSVRHISVRVLRGLGYNVIEAANGDDAQRLLAERAGSDIDLLLTDMVMPQMSGRSFANWLHKESPQTKVVFASGYLEESLSPGDRIENGMFFLPKPFDPEQLATTIRGALDS